MRRANDPHQARRRDTASVIGTIALVLVAACGDPAGVYDDDANQFDLPRDTDAAIQTDRLEYRLEPSVAGLHTRIAIEWTNPTGRTVYLANCPVEDDPRYRVDLLRDGATGLQTALESPELDCAGAPLVIEPGATLVDTLEIAGFRPGGPEPAFRVTPVAGVYRLLIRSAFHTYDLEHKLLADSVATVARVSNRFGLIEPD